MNTSREERKLSMKKILSIITAMVMIFCLMPPVRPFADNGDIIYFVYDTDGNKTAYRASAYTVDENTTVWNTGIYAVTGTVEISERIEVTGSDVNLILTDGCSLTAKQGIHLKEGNSLTIYGQTNSTGTLIAEFSDSNKAAIGGNNAEHAGNIEIHGGKTVIPQYDAEAFRANPPCAAAIGGGNMSNGGSVTVFNGTVDIQCQETWSAGIGGGLEETAVQ